MQIELCDICGGRLMTYIDNGQEYKPIRMKQKTAKKLTLSTIYGFETWEPMSICGECRAMLARAREQEQQKSEHEKPEE